MKIECEKCGIKDIGRYKKLVERGWKIFFLFDGLKVVRCKKCKPTWKDKVKMKFSKDYKPEMYYDIKVAINKLKLLKGLKTKEENSEESMERRIRKRKHYHYQRHICEKEGNKKSGYSRLLN